MASPTQLLTPSPRPQRHLSPTLLSPLIGPISPSWATLSPFLGTIGPLGLAVSQLLVGSASIQRRRRHHVTKSTPPCPCLSLTKGYNFRRTGMTTLFTQASSLVDFQNAVWDHLVDCGMDTIAYLPDPESSSVMTNVVRSHSRYTVATAKTLSSQQILRYDKYDKSNDLAATKFLLSSLDPAHSKIKEDGRRRLVSRRLAPAHQDDQSTSIERFEDLKAAIKARHPSQYAGENLEALAADYRKDAVSSTAGQYDHNLTLTMLKTFLLAGGAGNEDFRFPLRSTKQKLDQAPLDIGYKEKSGAHAHMVAEKLAFKIFVAKLKTRTVRNLTERNGLQRVMHLMSELRLRRLAMSQLPRGYLPS
ncbi:hypothetical protein MHU86_5422 [Fragilaria crotonensis]|nr:hypothetical protein MHU86_5422 [Fragilaria crotonensis]